MAEPLVISFAADTTRAQSAMATLAAQIVGNMTAIGVAMSGGAANSNGFGASLQGLVTNAQRAAAAVGRDVTGIVTATATAATAEKATLESVIGSFTAAAAASQTVQAGVKAGVTGTATALTTLAAQVPSLKLLATGFVAFEVGKLALEAFGAAAAAASAQLERIAGIGDAADRLGVSTTFLQTYLGQARTLKVEADDLTKALEKSKAAFTVVQGEGGPDAHNQSAFEARLRQQAGAGNVTPEQVDRFAGARGFEAQNRAALDIITEIQAKGRDLAALDLAGRLFPPELVERIRDGAIELDRFKAALADVKNPDLALFTPEEINRAQELQRRLEEAQHGLGEAGDQFNRELARAGEHLKEDAIAWTEMMTAGARGAVAILSNIRRMAAEFSTSNAGLATGGRPTGLGVELGAAATGGKTPPKPAADREMEDALNKLRGNLGNRTLIDQAQRASRGMTDALRRETSAPIVHRRPRAAGGARETDPVESFIDGMQKQTAALKAETDAFARSNAQKLVAVQLARAQAIASQNGTTLTDAQAAAIRKAAEETAHYRDTLADLEQAQRQAAEATRFFGEAAANGLADAIVEGRSFGAVLSGLVKQIERSALQALVTGSGPLAGLLGTAAPASAGGNAVGGLAGLLSGGPGLSLGNLLGGGSPLPAHFAANGGPVGAGQPVTVGEMGREVFVPNADGRIVPIAPGGGAGGGPQVTIGGDTITITAAQGVTPQQMLAALALRDQQFRRGINGIVAEGQRRYPRVR